MSLDVFLSRLTQCKPSGKNRWRACCPAHGGSNRNALAILEAPDGAVLIHCHVMQCAPHDIAAAVGMDVGELLPRADKHSIGHHRPIAKPWPAKWVLEALDRDLRLAYVLFADIEKGRVPLDHNREKAAEAKKRMSHIISELDRAY